jgi:hypothetical protein
MWLIKTKDSAPPPPELQVYWNILKYTINTLKYIHILSNTLKDIEIYYKDIICTFINSNTFKYFQIH